MKLLSPLRDVNDIAPAGCCRVCGVDIYSYENSITGGLCSECWRKQNGEENCFEGPPA